MAYLIDYLYTINFRMYTQNNFNFLTASLPGTPNAHQLVVSIRQKCTPEEVLEILKDLPHPDENDGDMIESTFNPLKIDVFVQTLLNLGSKSFSHSFAAISKFHLVFKVCKRTKLKYAYKQIKNK